METELKPCPFCGSNEMPEEWDADYSNGYIQCTECGGEVRTAFENQTVKEVWNTRKRETQLAEENDLLKEKLRRIIRLYRVDDDAWNPEEETDRLLAKELAEAT